MDQQGSRQVNREIDMNSSISIPELTLEQPLIIQLFEQHVKQDPDAVATFHKERRLTYGQLNSQANRLAHDLIRQGAGPETIIGIALPRSDRFVVAQLAVWKAGALFLPIDTGYPLERITTMFRDARPLLVVTQSSEYGSLPSHVPKLIWDEPKNDILDGNTTNPNKVHSQNGAYLIYTSGSTGVPKGVLVSHAGINSLAIDQSKRFQISKNSRVLQYAPINFDANISELVTTFVSGATLVIPTEEERQGDRLTSFIRSTKVTHATLPPALLATIEGELDLETLIVAGDVFPDELAQKWCNHHRVINGYGPTESTVCTTMSEALSTTSGTPIGQPIANTVVYLLDPYLNPVPDGVIAELYISGAGLARGYLNDTALTAQRFIANPFGPAGSRMYRTGDLAVRRADGNLEFAGRIDRQLKIRGVRVEPEEIEKQLRKIPGIGEAVVVPVNTSPSNQPLSLAAYYTRASSTALIELWPSIAETYIYDELAYASMDQDSYRIKAYRDAFQKHLRDQIVVDLGTGPFANLARMAIEAGARHVYAIELLNEPFKRASQFVKQNGFSNRITVIHGDARTVELPEQADWCVFALIGSIGGSEGGAVIVENARRFLKHPENMLPGQSVTRIAGCAIPSLPLTRGFTETGAHYVKRLFADHGSPFDLRLCLKNVGPQHLITTSDLFESIDFTNLNRTESSHQIALDILEPSVMTGFLVWLDLKLTQEISLNILEQPSALLPIYLPLFLEGVQVRPEDKIDAHIQKTLSSNQLHFDYRIHGRILRNGQQLFPFSIEMPHEVGSFQGTPFYQKLFKNETVPCVPPITQSTLRKQLAEHLPSHSIPSWLIELPSLPLTPNGKIDFKALPPPKTGATVLPITGNPTSDLFYSIARKILQTEEMDINASFFELGGNSLLAIQLINRIKREISIELPVKLLLKDIPLREVARNLTSFASR
jgi:amino acid adenylation domain-containing protein